ncbi:Na+/H+ antiporter subunit D [Kineococcus sp. SYSU DK004]|uniref:Na+/H+ antiporter subunit D n=1 Tax=Kineococcus sp. SYSU DK004 TaxID=3383125 RepID=UPI003D7CD3F7
MRVLLPLPVLLPLAGAALTLLLGHRPRAQRAVSLLALTGVVAAAAALLARCAGGRVQHLTVGGWPDGVGIALVADRLSSLLLLTSATVALAVMVFSVGQGRTGDPASTPVSIYHPTYLAMTAGVAIAFLAGDLFNLYVGFEVLLTSSYVLLTLGGTARRVRAGTTYVVVSLVSSLVLLTGVGLVYAATGTVAMADLPARLAALDPGVATALQLTLLIAFGLKAAAFPLSGWLPDSYPAAAAPVAAVFAGLLTKVGVYAVLRTHGVLFGQGTLRELFLAVALATMLLGILGAVVQHDLRRVMSFTLVSHIGYMLFGVGLGSSAGLAAAVFYAVHHILVQTALFLVVGLVEQRTGTTDVRRLGGLAAASPALGLLFLLPGLNLAGIPPFSGFLGKLALLRAGVDDGGWDAWALVVASVVTSLLTLYAIARVWAAAFWHGGDRSATGAGGRAPEEVPDDAPQRAGGGAAVAARPRASRAPAAATAGVVVLVTALTVVAGPLAALARGAAEDTGDGRRYSGVVGGVVGGGAGTGAP